MGTNKFIYVDRYIDIMTKTVALSDEAYTTLDAIRGEKESFSKVVIRLVQERSPSLTDLKGIWKQDKHVQPIFDHIAKERRGYKLREVKF